MLGKPIVTTTSQGTRDYIEQNQTALISPPKDIEALAENIKKLWSDSNLCAKLGEACQTVSNHKFNLVNWTDYLENYLRNNYLRKDK